MIGVSIALQKAMEMPVQTNYGFINSILYDPAIFKVFFISVTELSYSNFTDPIEKISSFTGMMMKQNANREPIMISHMMRKKIGPEVYKIMTDPIQFPKTWLAI